MALSFARIGLLLLPLVSSVACTQYKPQGSLSSLGGSQVGLVPTSCSGKKEVFRLVDGSNMSWSLETISSGTSNATISSKHSASGFLETTRGALSDSAGLVTFAIAELSTGDVARDRKIRDELFTDKGVETFRLRLEKIDTKETGVATGSTKSLSMVGIVEIGGRKAQVIFPAVVTESSGVYLATGSVELGTRDSRPAVNAIYLGDKISKLESALGQSLANTLRLDMRLQLKKDCEAAH